MTEKMQAHLSRLFEGDNLSQDDARDLMTLIMNGDCADAQIGAALGALHGAAMLCYVTPKEHLGLPNSRDVRDGVLAYKIAAHAADIGCKLPGARTRDDAISRARRHFDWETRFELALDPAKARELRAEALTESNDPHQPEATAPGPPPGQSTQTNSVKQTEYCTMCGPKFCSMRVFGDLRADMARENPPKTMGGRENASGKPGPPANDNGGYDAKN